MGTESGLVTGSDQGRLRFRFLAAAGALWALLGAASAGCGGAAEEPRCVGDGCEEPDCEGDRCDPPPRPCATSGPSGTEATSLAPGAPCPGDDWLCPTVGCERNGCVYAGQPRADGSTFPATDGCNTCTCSDGAVACTERGCIEPSFCELRGQRLQNGDVAPAGDGCNTCTCLDGSLACTMRECFGCFGDSECGEEQYCAFPVGACVSSGFAGGAGADAGAPADREGYPAPIGECRERPALCTAEQAPVCGCDGQTYRSACAAASLGLSLAREGACASGG